MAFHQKEEPPNANCKLFAAVLKDIVFCNCHTFTRLLDSGQDEEHPTSDFDEEELVVSEIRSRAMEKLRRKPSRLIDGFSLVYSPMTRELLYDNGDGEGDDFLSVRSCFTCCSSAASRNEEQFLSVKTDFSSCSSFNGLEFGDFLDGQGLRRRSIIEELCHCEGWPFGLCRKAVLLPPLPKSPAEPWSWRSKTTKVVKMPSYSGL